MKIGDYVTHNTFPPVEGYVSAIQPTLLGGSKVAVLRNDTNTLFWDDDCTWDIVVESVDGYFNVSNDAVIDVEYIEVIE